MYKKRVNKKIHILSTKIHSLKKENVLPYFPVLQKISGSKNFGWKKFSDVKIFGRIKCPKILTSEIFCL